VIDREKFIVTGTAVAITGNTVVMIPCCGNVRNFSVQPPESRSSSFPLALRCLISVIIIGYFLIVLHKVSHANHHLYIQRINILLYTCILHVLMLLIPQPFRIVLYIPFLHQRPGTFLFQRPSLIAIMRKRKRLFDEKPAENNR